MRNESNTIISPFLAKLLMSLLAEAAGSNTSTERELATVWPMINSLIPVREHYIRLFESLSATSEDYDLNIGVKMYVDNFINPGQRFKAIAKAFYQTDIEKLDFGRADDSSEHINSWVRNITKNLIKEIVTKG